MTAREAGCPQGTLSRPLNRPTEDNRPRARDAFCASGFLHWVSTIEETRIVQAFKHPGASVTMTTIFCHALILVEHDGLSAAIMDHGLSGGDSTRL
jgi:hypothetical protein